MSGLLLTGCGTLTSAVSTTVPTAVPAVATTVTVTTTDTVTSTDTVSTTDIVTTISTTTVTADLDRPDPDTPGPEGGPPCPVDPAYNDETTAGLAGDVAAAWTQATAAAAAAGVTLCVHDGKRSRAQQRAIFDDYVHRYGQAAAEAYVLPPDRSAHVAGDAIDVQPAASAAWLQATDGALGFCRMYDNEVWHFEFAQTFRLGCPPRRGAPAG